jgi:heptosyltransferase-2
MSADRSGVRRILVAGPAWVGDMIMAQTLFRVLALRHAGAEIDVIAPDWSRPLLERMPEVHRAIVLPAGPGQLALGARWRIGRSLRARKYDWAIVVKRTFKSALIPAIAGIPRRTGTLGEARWGLLNDLRKAEAGTYPLNHRRYVALALDEGEELGDAELPHPALQVDAANRHRVVARLGLDLETAPVGLAPGARYGPAKHWPETHWIDLCKALVEMGRPVWIFGADEERAVGERIERAVGPGVTNLAGRTSLVDAVDLASLCGCVVSNDSGLMHLAAAAGAHTVALFGSTSPRNTPPLTDRRTILWRELSCSPCFARECPLGHHDCLEGIMPATVVDACVAALAVRSDTTEPIGGDPR